MIRNILFVCTSNKDRSPALVNYFKELYPKYQYRSAGVNRYFTSVYGTELIEWEDILWADLIVFAEPIHAELTWHHIFNVPLPFEKEEIVLDCGDFNSDSSDDYLTKAEAKISFLLI